MKRLLALLLILSANLTHAALPIQTWTLPNGARVLYVEHRGIPVIDLSIEFDAGSRRDPLRKSGLAALTNGLLASGVAASATEAALNEAQLSDAFADTAAQRHMGVSADRAGIALRALSSQPESDAAIRLTARLLAQPAFPEALLMREKTRTIAALKEAETKPNVIASKAFMRAIYGHHPYANSPTAESLDAITRTDLITFHRTHYVASRAVVSIVGDVSRERAGQIAKQLTGHLPPGNGEALPALPEVPPMPAAEQRIAHPASQAHILLGAPAAVRGDPDFFALTVGNYVLGGGGFVSRLMHEVREKRGLSYSVGSSFSPMKQAGPFTIGLQTKKEQANEALKVTRDVLTSFLKDGPTDDEIKAAKDNLIGGFSLRIDNNRKILSNVALIGFYGLPLDYLDTWTVNIAKVSADDIRAAFGRKIAAEQLATVIVGAPE
ncbi:MAG: insulinase family protein [Burkholderiaceae bacterium]|nr:insulinase family protein [Burkholderiaceae bacterium]